MFLVNLSSFACICVLKATLIRLYVIGYSPILQFWRQLYLLTVLSLILAVFCAQVHPRYLSNDWKRIRMAIFCCVAGISVVPSCHWVGLNGGLSTDVVQVRQCHKIRKQAKLVYSFYNKQVLLRILLYVQLFLPRILVMYLIAGTAFLFYVTKIPERYFPGESSSSVS